MRPEREGSMLRDALAMRMVLALVLMACLLVPVAAAQPASPPAARAATADPATQPPVASREYRPPADIAFRTVTIMSEGVRLHGEVFTPKAARGKLPAVLIAHGWGGVAAGFRRDAEEMARAGFLVLTFDYRGWGESDPRVILTGPAPPVDGNAVFTAQVQAVRGYIDPFEQAQDWFNAINWAEGEPAVDADRIGLRGSSYSGGIILHVAAHDDRVKALVSQVGGIGSRPDPAARPVPGSDNYQRWLNRHQGGVRMARGEAGYPPPKARTIGNLVGAPVGDKLTRWWPNEDAANVTAPALFILAENEELVNNATNGQRAFERVKGPKKLVVIPGIKHYGIYREARPTAVRLAIDWFKQHLASPGGGGGGGG